MRYYDFWCLINGIGRRSMPTPEEQAEGHRRLAEWWRWKQYYRRFDRCCHGKR